MLTEYVEAALEKARYKVIEDKESFFGEIPPCRGVWATGRTLEECRRNLKEALEGWLVVSFRRGLPIPAIGRRRVAAASPKAACAARFA